MSSGNFCVFESYKAFPYRWLTRKTEFLDSQFAITMVMVEEGQSVLNSVTWVHTQYSILPVRNRRLQQVQLAQFSSVLHE